MEPSKRRPGYADGARWEVYTVLGDSDVGTPAQQEVAVSLGRLRT